LGAGSDFHKLDDSTDLTLRIDKQLAVGNGDVLHPREHRMFPSQIASESLGKKAILGCFGVTMLPDPGVRRDTTQHLNIEV